MNVTKDSWVGVDLDGTLAEENEWVGPSHIGDPIPNMVNRVKEWLANGVDVRILTARVSANNVGRDESLAAIDKWTTAVFGQTLPCRACKDQYMIQLWDDRCVQVVHNKGDRVGDVNVGEHDRPDYTLSTSQGFLTI